MHCLIEDNTKDTINKTKELVFFSVALIGLLFRVGTTRFNPDSVPSRSLI